jgi:hypothetical protein
MLQAAGGPSGSAHPCQCSAGRVSHIVDAALLSLLVVCQRRSSRRAGPPDRLPSAGSSG